ncbi:hypothetical protein [Salegentibacter salegens]|uniref:EpsG family protein n=1 Tax=Salegentibacter salegens TaxID=143223 RepID=A0A1M7HDL2_9FLAO|nr:hypothetical protein [Salegentibacter salegens]PRX43490.1 hypothetical protein LY58_02298 [Salegentibacter salegens]SHM26621.1 hypothetical protein SAMN05878281_0095 [Salegentibacter salegens]
MNQLFWYHIVFLGIYYTYTIFNRSDSLAYYDRAEIASRTWAETFGTSTTFIDFLAYPFVNFFNFNYEMMMALFAWFGYLGFVYAYVFFRENIPIKITVFKNFDLLTLILFFPNMHFWTASLGKGAPIFLGLMLFAYAIKNPKSRLITLILGSLLIYYIRPHVFMFVAVGTVLGYMSGKEKISFGKKLFIYISLIGGLVLVQDTILGMAGLEGSEDFTEDFSQFSEGRSDKLATSGSGVDMSSYPLPIKFFTFWFRPLFFDAPGILGLITSVENLMYLLLFFKVLKKDFIKFIKNSPIAVKMSLVVFLLASFAMTFVMSNLGIIMRQKSMVMYFAFFVIYYYLAQKKYDKIIKLKRRRKNRNSEVVMM